MRRMVRSAAPVAASPQPPTVSRHPAPPHPVAEPPVLDDPATSFTRRRAVRWLNPGLLLRSAGEVVISGVMGEYNDKRELMGSLPADDPLDLRTKREDVWLDYVSDTGDGFNAAYAVASLLAQGTLDADDGDGGAVTTPRGEVMVMGGDQCYPTAHVEAYEDRLIGPYRAALPHVDPPEGAPRMLTIPGNHDWYDGLTSFMRTFCQRRWIGGWLTAQSRSYFAVKLPGRWWLWGIDIQFDTYIDDIQYRYFKGIAGELERGDAVILCSAKPSWVAAGEEDLEAYTTLDYIERNLITPRGARLRVCLSGDRHHYARYEASDGGQKITAGGGGAYLSPTHHLPESIAVPPAVSKARGKSAPTTFERRVVFPDHRQSRRRAWGVLGLPWATPKFALLMGGVQAVFAVTMVFALSPEMRALPERIRLTAAALRDAEPSRLASALADSLVTVVLVLLVLGAAIAFTKRPRSVRGFLAGLVHGALHVTLAIFVTYLAATVAAPLPGRWMLLGLLPLVFVIGGLVATELVAAYLLVADRFGLNSNETFAAQAIQDYKNFLRLHVTHKGDLKIYPVGLERVPRKWKVNDGPFDRTRFSAVGKPLQPFLIESPVCVSPDPGPTETATAATEEVGDAT